MGSGGIYEKLRVLIVFRLLFVTVLLTAFFILQLEHGIFPYPRLILFLIAFIYFLNIVYLLFVKYRLLKPVLFGYIQLSVDIVLEIVLILFTGGIESWFTITLLLTVIASSIVLGKRAGYVMAALSGILYGVVIDLQYYQIIPVAFSDHLAGKDFLYNIIINLLALYLTSFLIGYLTSGLETTKQSLFEKSSVLDELSQFHSEVMENIPSGLFSADLYGNVRLINMAAEDITDIPRGKAITLKIDDMFGFVNIPIRPARYSGIIDTKDGIKNIGMSISEHRNQNNEPVGYIGTFQDLTEIVRLERDMKKKERFAVIGELSANIAHEIRNPLASIKGSIEMIKEGKIGDTDKQKLMEIALTEMTRLNTIITNFLNYSNPKPLIVKRFDISSIVRGTITLLKSSLSETSEVRLFEEIDSPLYISGDEDKIKQVFWNLLANAVESLNNEGDISVKASEKRGSVVIEISDTGVGISEKDMERIFYPFYTTKKDGTGLGLAIAYRIIDEHGGNIDVSSIEGSGTMFKVTIPANEVSVEQKS